MERFTLYSLFLFFLILSCEKEAMVQIDNELQTYIDQFEDEALNRGLDINLAETGIHAFIQGIEGAIVGQCQHKEDEPNVILLDRNYWDNATEDEKVLIVFHELGHCVLKKEHNDQKDANGFCLSIMHSSSQVCKIDFSPTERDSYFDELFNN